ncbi:hypothetical protein [Mycobacterium sp.]|uniref:hypothetical protein n=1 Tax=Mycobacterium sp. TaxID=1785 RepID=UPI003C768987
MTANRYDEGLAVRREVLLQAAVYCGVPDANAAFRIAASVFDEADKHQDSP